jgi:hypothetical protein
MFGIVRDRGNVFGVKISLAKPLRMNIAMRNSVIPGG